MNTSREIERWSVRSADDLGRAISGIRKMKGLRQADLAEELGIDRQYLVRLEAGQGTLAIERALRALRRMGAEVTVTLPEGRRDQEG